MGFPGSSAGKVSTCNAGNLGSISGSGRSPGEEIGYPLQDSWASLVAQLIKNLPTVRETWVRSLGWEDPPEEGEPYPLQYSGLENSTDYTVRGVAKSRTQLSDIHFIFNGRKLFYNVVLVSKIHQHKSAIGIHMPPPS